MKCTGRNCPMQNGTVDPSHCLADECPYVTKPLTNADKIRAMSVDKIRSMSVEELAEWLAKADPVFWSKETWLKWLQKEAEE